MKGLAVLFGKSWATTPAHSMPCCTASPALAKAACPLGRLLAIVFPQSEQTSLNRDPDRNNITVAVGMTVLFSKRDANPKQRSWNRGVSTAVDT